MCDGHVYTSYCRMLFSALTKPVHAWAAMNHELETHTINVKAYAGFVSLWMAYMYVFQLGFPSDIMLTVILQLKCCLMQH